MDSTNQPRGLQRQTRKVEPVFCRRLLFTECVPDKQIHQMTDQRTQLVLEVHLKTKTNRRRTEDAYISTPF